MTNLFLDQSCQDHAIDVQGKGILCLEISRGWEELTPGPVRR